MKTVAVIAQKGGTGKTTVTVNLAVSAYAAGLKAMVLDMDPQGSSADWSRSRDIAGPAVMPIKIGSLFPAQYTAQNAGLDLMLIDTRGGSPADILVAAKAADLCLVVVRPTVIDLRAIAGTVDLIKPLGRPAAFVLNQAPCARVGRDPVMVMEAIELLMGYGLPLAPVALRNRLIYQSAFMAGRSPREVEPGSPAADELDRLWRFTAERLWPEPARAARTPLKLERPAAPAMALARRAPPAETSAGEVLH